MKKILIVEDELLISHIIESYVNSSGCSTVLATVDNGDDAIRIAGSEIPDLILMDVRIEGDKDGIETAEIINREKSIPIVYLSGNSDEKTTSRAKKTNMYGFLTKPVDKQDLHNIICNTIDPFYPPSNPL